MSARFLLAAAVALLAGPALPAADKPPKPTVVVQVQPVSKIVADVKELIRLAAGPKEGDAAVKQFIKELEDVLGEKGFEGLDLNRPAAAYAVVREKFEDSSLVVVAPYSTEKEFLGLLERLKFKAEAVEGKKGVYKVTPPEEDAFPHESYLRFADGWAYVAFNGEDALDPAKLVPAADLFDPAETALAAVRLYPDRFPEKLLKQWLGDFENGVNGLKMFLIPGDKQHVSKGLNTIVDQSLKLIRRYGETLQRDCPQAVLRYTADPLTGEQTVELVVTPKPGSQLAKDIAALKPTPNRFFGLTSSFPGADGKPGTAAGVTGRLPLAVPELRGIAVAVCDIFEGESAAELPEPLRPVAVELFKGLARTAKKGDADFAAAMIGPGKTGRFTAVGAVAFDDPAALEKALRDAAKNPLVGKVLKLDADKAGDLAVHTIAVGEFLDPDVQKVFGNDAVVCLVFGKDALFVSFGPPTEALAAVKAAATYPAPKGGMPQATQYLAAEGNFARLAKLVAAAGGEQEGKEFAELMGSEDKLVPLGVLTVEGGDKLVIRYKDNVKHLFRSLSANPSPDMRPGNAPGKP